MKLSVIIPTRDRVHFLKDAVESVLSQTQQDFELIIVNDGATHVPAFNDQRIRLLYSAQRGAVAARNLGVAAAIGDIIAWLDDDDQWIASDHLAAAVDVLSHQDVLYFTDGVMAFPGGSASRKFACDTTAATLEKDNTILVSSVCYRRALHDVLGPFDPALPYYWDWDWYLRVVRSGRMTCRRPVAAVRICVHADNMSGDSNRQQRRDNCDLLMQKHALTGIVLKNHTDFVSAPR